MNIDSNCNNIDEILKVGSEMILATDEDNQPGRSTAAATETDENKKSKKKSYHRTAKEELTRYLGTRMRTVEESRKHLLEKEYEEDEVAEAINRFLELGYLDDSDYCRVYCGHSFAKCRGRMRITNELRQRGVDSETIRNAIDDYVYEEHIDEVALARKLTERTVAGCARPVDQRMAAKVARKLEQQGYSTSIILRMLNEIKE